MAKKDFCRFGLTVAMATALLAAGWVGGGLAQEEEPAVAVQMAFGAGVDRAARTLTAEAETFTADVGQVFCLARIQGLDAPAEVTFAWYHDGRTMARVPLAVRSSDYRTWSSKNVMPSWTGPWEVKILDETGKVLASASFTVQ